MFGRKDKFKQLEEEVATLKRQVSDYGYEVQLAVEKTQRLFQRLIKRAERETALPNPPPGEQPSLDSGGLDPVSASILRRRNRSLAGKLPTEDT